MTFDTTKARSERFGFDRANKFLAPTVPDVCVGNSNYELLRGVRAAAETTCR